MCFPRTVRHVQQVTSRRELHNNREFSIMGLFCTMLSLTRLGRPVSALTLTRSMCVFVYLSTDCPRFLLSANLLLLDNRMRQENEGRNVRGKEGVELTMLIGMS